MSWSKPELLDACTWAACARVSKSSRLPRCRPEWEPASMETTDPRTAGSVQP